VSFPEEANNCYDEAQERSQPIDLNALMTLLFLHPKLDPIHCPSQEGTRKRYSGESFAGSYNAIIGDEIIAGKFDSTAMRISIHVF